MSTNEGDAAPAVALRSAMGKPCPTDLGPGLATLLDLPQAVQDTFFEVLEPNLGPVVDDRAETIVKRYCRRYEIEPSMLAPAVKACRFLFMEAVKAGADRDAFIADVEAIVPGERSKLVLERVLPLFDAAYAALRKVAVFQTIAEHGRVVRSVHWRLDLIKASDHSMKIDMPIATITLQYQEGPNAGQASYQLLPDQVAELKRALAFVVD